MFNALVLTLYIESSAMLLAVALLYYGRSVCFAAVVVLSNHIKQP